MSSVKLLDKTRKIGRLLHNGSMTKVIFSDVCAVMTEVLGASVLVISKKGKVLGVSLKKGVDPITGLLANQVGERVDANFNDRLLNVLSTKENVNLEILGFNTDGMPDYNVTVTPIEIGGKRLGSLFVYRTGKKFDIDDIILCEYASTVVGLETMRAVHDEGEEERRKAQLVKSAVGTLSLTERKAVRHILEELDGCEGMLVASRVADRAGITRSVVVNAMKKLESAGVIETKSSGMKGTAIKILNSSLAKELEEYDD